MALVTTAMTGPLFDRFAPAAAPTDAAAKRIAETPTVAESKITEK
jgi:hypothetical protein